MLWPLLIAAAMIFVGTLPYGVAMNLLVRLAVWAIRRDSGSPKFWKNTAVMALITLVTAAAHLTQIALWAVALLACGQFSDPATAFYFSAQNYTALGYGDVLLPEPWRLLGPLEAVNGLLTFGLSTALLFAVLSRLISHRIHAEIK